MRVLRATDQHIESAAEALRAGELVAFPTETVYGLGADALNGEAVARIFAAKGRPRFNPLIVHVADQAAARRLADLPPLGEMLARAFWPGSLTMVLEQRVGSGLSDLVSAGLTSVAIRVPSHPVAVRLIKATDRPLAAPSANRSGHVSATTAEHVVADFEPVTGPKPSIILDDGPTAFGIESTIVDVRSGAVRLLRPGAVPSEAIEDVTGVALEMVLPEVGSGGDARSSPGQLESHYAPRKTVIVNVSQPAADQALLAFGANVPNHAGPLINISPSGDLIEAAANLFAALRELDRSEAGAIAVMPIPDRGLGRAINDRLKRAAAPR